MIKLLALCTALLLPSTSFAVIIGEESRRIVSSDPETPEGRLAGVVGISGICGGSSGLQNSGTMSMVLHNGRVYVIGAAHATLYPKTGELRCPDDVLVIAPDHHLGARPDADRYLQFKANGKPLNYETMLDHNTPAWSPENINDFSIHEWIGPPPILDQFGQPRPFLTLARMRPVYLRQYSRENTITFMSQTANFHSYREKSFQTGCLIYSVHPSTPVLKHDCDSGAGSSGAPLISARQEGGYFHLGVHYAGIASATDDIAGDYSVGNYFIPSEYVLAVLEDLVGVDYYNPEPFVGGINLSQVLSRKDTICNKTPRLCAMYTYAVSDFLRRYSPIALDRAAQILRNSAEGGFGPALMDLGALREFDTTAALRPLSAQWPRGAGYYEGLFLLKPQFPTDIEAAADAYIAALQNGDASLLNRSKADWPAPLASAMQTRLKALGHYSGPIDGDFGRGSMAAIARLCGCQ